MKSVKIKILLFVLIIYCFIGTLNFATYEDEVHLKVYDCITQEWKTITIQNLSDREYFDSTSTQPPIFINSNGNHSNFNQGITPYHVLGDDDRTMVDNVMVSPYSKIVALVISFDRNNDGIADVIANGTGFMVGPKCMITAAHNMFHRTYGKALMMKIYTLQNSPDYTGEYYLPASWAFDANYFTTSYPQHYDWCVVKLQTEVGRITGWFGTSRYVSLGKQITAAGYPLKVNKTNQLGYQYTCSGSVARIQDGGKRCAVTADFSEGQSGGPIFSGNTVYAIISSSSSGFSVENYGININSTIQYWIDIISRE